MGDALKLAAWLVYCYLDKPDPYTVEMVHGCGLPESVEFDYWTIHPSEMFRWHITARARYPKKRKRG